MSSNPSNRRLLVVDDDPDFASSTCELLATRGWEAVSVASYDDGLRALEESQYAAVLLDYALGDRTGIEFAFEAIRRDLDAPIILLTAESGHDVVEAAARVGAAGYLVKGNDIRTLVHTLVYAIEHRRVEREAATRARQQIAVAELSLRALRTSTREELFQAAMTTLAHVLRVPSCELFEVVGPRRLRLRAGFGSAPSPELLDVGRGSLTELAMAVTEPLVIDDFSHETRFVPPAPLLARGVRSAVCAPLHGRTEPHGLLEVFADVPARFSAEDALFVHSVAQVLSSAIQRDQTESAARAVFNGALDAMGIVDDDGTILEVNDAACQLVGVARDGLVGRCSLALPLGMAADTLRGVWSAFLASGQHRGEYRFANRDGERIVEIFARARIRPGQHLAVLRDVTDTRRTLEELRRSEANFRQLMEAAPDAILVIRDHQIVYVNSSASRMFGYERHELIGSDSGELIAPEERERVFGMSRIGLRVGDSASIAWTCRRRDGSRIVVETNLLIVVLDGQPTMLSFCRDVTERKRGEDALRRSEANLRALIERLPDGIMVNRGGAIVYANTVVTRMLGYQAPAELIGRDSLAPVHPKITRG